MIISRKILSRFVIKINYSFKESNELNELYDDVVNPPASKTESDNTDTKAKSSMPSTQSSHAGKRYATYLGHLTWWTTEADILEAFNSIGIRDILEIKFHENRQNGQSKGFCIVIFSSEASVKAGMDKIRTIQIHGNTPLLTYCTKQSLAQFEKSASNDASNPSSSGSAILGAASNNRTASGTSNGRLPPPLMSAPTIGAQLGFSVRGSSSLMGRASSNRSSGGALPLNIPNLSQGIQNLFMSGFNLPSTLSNAGSGLIPTPQIALPGASGTNAHINPNFLQQSGLNQTGVGANPLLQAQLGASVMRPQLDQFNRSVVQNYSSGQSSKISDAEFDSIMKKNKTVSSTAISRAVQDAANGNYSRAIETLVTAIALIGQSKIAHDDRCKILINSLKDTKNGIEEKSYGSKSGSGSRRRRRSYSRSGSDEGADDDYRSSGSRRHHRSSRPRSRSRTPRGSRGSEDRHRRSSNGGGRDYYSSAGGGGRGSNSPAYRYRQ
ncbi:hypothetical protein Aperf_G00000036083 [Anoplocephala perfoliata]